jgi:hypothetical protein
VTIAAPARDLLISCSVWDATAAELDRVRERARAVEDWDAWLRLVRMHRLVPHARRALLDSGAVIPPAVARELDAGTLAIAARALGRARQLAELVRLLDRAGVRAMPFKGPVLSLVAYGSVGVRDSADLDLVVRPRDLVRAQEAMRAAGYASRSGMSLAQERALQRSYGHFSYAYEGAPAGVELHWQFAASRYPWSMPPDDVFTRARVIELAGTDIAIPGPTDDLLLQAMHGARHQWERLEWLVAFGRLLRNEPLDERTLIERARANGSNRALRVGLRLAQDVLGVPLPSHLAAISSDESSAARASGIVRAIDSGSRSTEEPYTFNLGMMDHAGDRARYVALSVFAPTPREWELVRLPDWLLPLYYPLRLARVLALRPLRAVSMLTQRLRSLFVRR